jgi:type II secretory pathway pseudopilin PulG
MDETVFAYTGLAALVHDFQVLIAACIALLAAATALLSPQIQNLILRSERKKRLASRLAQFRAAMESYQGGLMKVSDRLESLSQAADQGVLPFARPSLTVPVAPNWEKYVSEFTELVPRGLFDKLIAHEIAVADLQSMGTSTGTTIVFRGINERPLGIDGSDAITDLLSSRINDTIAASGELITALEATGGNQ